MDLSQQELPLTAHFTRGNKNARSRKKDKHVAEDSQAVTRSLKRKRNDVSTTPVGQSELRPKILQLPTPAASTRKPVRGGRVEDLPGKSRPTSSSASAEHKATLAREKELAQLEFALESPRESPGDAISELPCTSLATPSTDRRRTTKSVASMFLPGHRLPNDIETGVATPQATSKRAPQLRHRIDHSPLAHSDHPLLSKPKDSVFAPRDGASVPLSKSADDQSSTGHVIPMFPIPSSQSQYLLHIDATPKRKQRFQHIEHVSSSQTQEERELTLSSSLKPAAMVNSSSRASPGKHTPRANPQTPRLRCGGRKSQHPHTLGSSPVGSSTSTPTGPSRSFVTKKASNELSPEFLSPSRRKILTSCHSPSRKTGSFRALTHHDSIENIPCAQREDSVTESESEVDILQVPCHSRASRDGCPPMHRGFAQSNLPSTEDDSATEAESDTEILHCVAEIGKKRPPNRQSEVLREDAPPLPVISPLVTPARSRIAVMSPIMEPIRFSIRENAGLRTPDSCTPHPYTMEQPGVPPESLPSAVRNFIRMFHGDDESYPAEFPESLRI